MEKAVEEWGSKISLRIVVCFALENAAMSVEDEIKIAELKLKQLEIQQKEHEITAKTRFDLTRAAVLVTVIGGMSAVLFQGVGALTAWNEKKKAEVTAKSDFDFKGLELFIKEQGNLITCDQDESNRNLRLFQSLFSETVTRGFNEIVAYRSQKCVTQSANSATDRAKSASKSEAQVNAAADAARYAAVAQQAPLLSAGIEAGQARYRVFIHINSDTDRTAAATLQAALDGFNGAKSISSSLLLQAAGTGRQDSGLARRVCPWSRSVVDRNPTGAGTHVQIVASRDPGILVSTTNLKNRGYVERQRVGLDLHARVGSFSCL